MSSTSTEVDLTDPAGLKTQDYQHIDQAHVWHPLYQHQNLEQSQLTVFEQGEGVFLTDSDGNRYLDAYSGLWNVNVGYGRQEIADAVYQQIQKLPYYPLSQINKPAALLAQRLADLLPGSLNHVFFSNSGSEANETAIKMARQYGRQRFPKENRYKIISRYRGYHGFTYGAMSATGQARRKIPYEPLAPGFKHVHPLKVEEIEQVIQWEGPQTVVAVIAEPIIGGGGVIIPPDDYFPRLREICDKYKLLLIIDEVITGFGRTGELFACHHWDLQPDIITLAKGITSGYLPLGACVSTDQVFEAFMGSSDDRLEFEQVCTYGGHPVVCAAARANLDILTREKLWKNAAQVGTYIRQKLHPLVELPIVKEVRGKGLMIAIELMEADGSNLATASTNLITQELKEYGILVGKIGHALEEPENILFLAPPLILTLEQADRIIDAVTTVISQH
ncbi:aspartate aminotransferase family protein [Candidatus Poribacteria bacterium]|jgi:adenosylmethionine-8-amino-7-oxononanoate aminotransferase|nr:aspartate aminotransferase family protein [Candidatus Poribacteria bacterium]MDP6596420.1 aminotransferase class III-fold pyridoxal phosphate-dependent enzyme [Candidatus Poribacteria bacterium]MDP6746183.1 aminotransferase class III-fold pyridoxal phosphate-dependent enzyme [Candidatus Poribacteria bacterium]MDP6995959.1 aminotransferase class III-fold pyridoxal phosphate-dependent enzyme [Candidatus Poribacteria bacterium]